MSISRLGGEKKHARSRVCRRRLGVLPHSTEAEEEDRREAEQERKKERSKKRGK